MRRQAGEQMAVLARLIRQRGALELHAYVAVPGGPRSPINRVLDAWLDNMTRDNDDITSCWLNTRAGWHERAFQSCTTKSGGRCVEEAAREREERERADAVPEDLKRVPKMADGGCSGGKETTAT